MQDDEWDDTWDPPHGEAAGDMFANPVYNPRSSGGGGHMRARTSTAVINTTLQPTLRRRTTYHRGSGDTRPTAFPPIAPTPERNVRIIVHGDNHLGAGFLLYFNEGLVVCSIEPGCALARAGTIALGDVLVAANGISLAVDTMDEALDIVRSMLPDVEFAVRGKVAPSELHLLEVIAEDDKPASPTDQTPVRRGPSFAFSDIFIGMSPSRTPKELARLVGFFALVLPVGILVSLILLAMAVSEGVVRLLANAYSSITGQSPAPVMSGENLCYDAIMELWYTFVLGDDTHGHKLSLLQSAKATDVVLEVHRAEIFSSSSKNDIAHHLKAFRGTRIAHERRPPSNVQYELDALDSARRRKLAQARQPSDYLRPGAIPETHLGRVDDPAKTTKSVVMSPTTTTALSSES
eukprot:m.211311 g.211311  ORF g.211311 m.211311 type:complete len:406 (+) comp25444_c0_seq1:409-1626(+)